jgi:hypothetical protein
MSHACSRRPGEGLTLCDGVRRGDAGAYLMPSVGRFEVVAEVLDAVH